MQENVFHAEIEAIREYQKRQSERLGYDIEEEEATRCWVEEYAAEFRDEWNKRMQKAKLESLQEQEVYKT